jgi:predicted DNA-binding transcriptional regulator AlpA
MHATSIGAAEASAGIGNDSHAAAPKPSRIPAPPHEAELLLKSLWSIPEAASFLRVSSRTVWRELSNPQSRFPRPRRIRGRTLLARDEVLAFIGRAAGR